ncbi:GGDEF domain-containing protein [Blastococcus sp. SYSU D00820]
MHIPPAFRARDPRSTARSGTTVMLVCAAALGISTAFGVNSHTMLIRGLVWSVVVVLLIGAVVCRTVPAERLDGSGFFLGVGLLGVLVICGLNLVTDDPSAGAQAFLAFPVLWVAAHQRRAAAVTVTAVAVASNAVVQPMLLPLEIAASDVGMVGTMLVAVALMLVRAAERQDQLVAAVHRQATVDSLTGLVNRRVLDDALTDVLARDLDAEGTSLVLVDVDSFKQINDVHGHPVGDDALVHLAGLVRGQIRAGDAVLSRLGGDEIAVLLPGCSAEVAARRAEALLTAVRSTPLTLPGGGLLALSVSIGVAHAPRHGADTRSLYAAADAALYEAKRAGRDRVAVAAG